MRILLEKREGFTVLHLRGDFDGLACSTFFKEIERRIAKEDVRVVLDLGLTRTMNSTAIGACIKASKALKKHGGELVFSNPTSYTKHSIESLGVNQLIQVFEDEAAALRHFVDDEPAAEVPHLRGSVEGKVTMLFSAVQPELSARLQELSDEVHGHKARHLGERHWRGVGHMAEVELEALQFDWEPATLGISAKDALTLFSPGVELEVSFGLTLLDKKRHHATVSVAEAKPAGDNIRMIAKWEELEDDTAKAIGRFVADLNYLRKELASAQKQSEAS